MDWSMTTVKGPVGAAMAETRICTGEGLRAWSALRKCETGVSECSGSLCARPSLETQLVSGPAGMRGGGCPLQRMPNSVQRYEASGPSVSLLGSKSWESDGAEQSSS